MVEAKGELSWASRSIARVLKSHPEHSRLRAVTARIDAALGSLDIAAPQSPAAGLARPPLIFRAGADLNTARAVEVLRSEQCIQLERSIPTATIAKTAKRAIAIFDRGSGDGFNEKFQVANLAMIDPTPEQPAYPLLHAIRESSIWDIATAYLGPSIYCVLPISYLRKVEPKRSDIAIPFHQDGLGLPDELPYRMLSIWMLLAPDSCGADAPSLEFLTGGPNHMLPFESDPSNKTFRNTQTADREIARLVGAGARLWVPEINLGDVMLFNQWNLHRAYISSTHKGPRYSFETRLVAKTPEATELFKQRGTSVVELHSNYKPNVSNTIAT